MSYLSKKSGAVQTRFDVAENRLIRIDKVPDNLLLGLENREVVLWVGSLPEDQSAHAALVAFIGLPWKQVFLEKYDARLIQALESTATFSDPMIRKRGFLQMIDSDPSRIELPERCLPVFLLNGRDVSVVTDFDNTLRRMTMLESLRRCSPRQILVILGDEETVPDGLRHLWSSGFRSYLTFIPGAANPEVMLTDWLEGTDDRTAVNLVSLQTLQVVDDVLARYQAVYPEDRHVIRVRDRLGRFHKIDVTEVDDPEHPILGRYSLIEERDLTPIMPEELSEEDFVEFFRNTEGSWRPYAAGLPWVRDPEWMSALSAQMKRLDSGGSEENRVLYISSETGAGGTTLARVLAWEYARRGYPVLVARPLPFIPDALPVMNFIKGVHRKFQTATQSADRHAGQKDVSFISHETPWLMVFDSFHWQDREADLARFRNEMEKSGRPVCVLSVMNALPGLSFFNRAVFLQIAELSHALNEEEALQLGNHLNRFLGVHGKQRQDWQWKQFHQNHTVRYLEGTAAFWVTLSFWIQRQHDLSVSIQEWLLSAFKENAGDRPIQEALVKIAALSSERHPLPESLLPRSNGDWPVSVLLEDRRSSLSALGLLRISAEGENYWALAHDILGRWLINAIFYDFPLREELGLAEAKDADHLRFLLLRQISQDNLLGEVAYRPIGEEFATSIFKIDPDHGRASFMTFWREVLDALDGMPRPLRDTSRVFRHHTAVSRRRVAKFDEKYYGVTDKEKIDLLNKAIEDIRYALNSIDYSPGSESNLNLFNSLANAYFDLAEVESETGASQERLRELRESASDATRRAYAENPTNPFVLETYVKNLLGQSSPQAIGHCIEALEIIFEALASGDGAYRKAQLGELADRALAILLKQSPGSDDDLVPTDAIGVLVNAWKILAEGRDEENRLGLADLRQATRLRALETLEHPAGRGNMQVIRLSFDLACIADPMAFKKQLDLLEQLQGTDYRMPHQLRLEYAILLFQNMRFVEGDKIFRSLRQIWRETEQFVQVPTRLRWLRAADDESLRTVQAITGSDYGHRAMARVRDFSDAQVPFRSEEFGIRHFRAGARFACHVSFGHNGPFLRPVTAGPDKGS